MIRVKSIFCPATPAKHFRVAPFARFANYCVWAPVVHCIFDDCLHHRQIHLAVPFLSDQLLIWGLNRRETIRIPKNDQKRSRFTLWEDPERAENTLPNCLNNIKSFFSHFFISGSSTGSSSAVVDKKSSSYSYWLSFLSPLLFLIKLFVFRDIFCLLRSNLQVVVYRRGVLIPEPLGLQVALVVTQHAARSENLESGGISTSAFQKKRFQPMQNSAILWEGIFLEKKFSRHRTPEENNVFSRVSAMRDHSNKPHQKWFRFTL